jgi:hypothetical protein
VPDYIIYPPDERINTLPGSITVPHPCRLSKIIEVLSKTLEKSGDKMTVDLATCQSYILPDPFKHPANNITARLDIFERDLNTLLNDYGQNLPSHAQDFMHHSLHLIIADAARAGLYLRKNTPASRRKAKIVTQRIQQQKLSLHRLRNLPTPIIDNSSSNHSSSVSTTSDQHIL